MLAHPLKSGIRENKEYHIDKAPYNGRIDTSYALIVEQNIISPYPKQMHQVSKHSKRATDKYST